MATPLPSGDPARAALNLSDEILARLDAATTPESKEQSPTTTEQKSAKERIRELDDVFRAKFQELSDARDAALDSGSEAVVIERCEALNSLIGKEQEMIAKELQDAQDYFDSAIREYGEAHAETNKAAGDVQEWRQAQTQLDTWYVSVREQLDPETVISELRKWKDETAVEAEQKHGALLSELLQTLEHAEAAYLARLDELKVQKQDVAQRIIDERVAAEKAKIGAK